MKTKYTKKQITEAIAHWQKVLENMNESEEPYEWDGLDKPVVTIGDLKDVLDHFNDYDVIDVLNEEGIDGYRFMTFWNAAYEKEVYDNSNTIPSEAKQHKCYIRIDKQ